MSRSFIHTLIALLFFQAYTFGQKGYTVTHYTDDNGMPQNSVRSLAADAEGFLWIATENGLARFDGQRFYVFDNALAGTVTNRFYMLQPSLNPAGAHSGRVNNGGVMYAVSESGEFVKIDNGAARLDSVYFKARVSTLPSIGEGPARTLLAGGLPTYLKDLTKPLRYIIPLRNGTGSYYLIDSTSVQFRRENGTISRTAFSPAGRLMWWNYFTLGQQLYYQQESGTILEISRGRVYPVNVQGDLLRDNGFARTFRGIRIFWNVAADQLFFCYDRKLYAVAQEDPHTLATRLVLEGFDMEKEAIQSIYRDPVSETIFLGSPSKGLFVLNRQRFEALTVSDGEIANVYYAAVPYDNDRVITPLGIIIGKDEATGKVFRGKIPLLEKLNPGDRRSLFYDQAGKLWVKMMDYIYQIDEVGGRVLRKWHLRDEIKHIYPDAEGNVWIATGTMGIYKIDLSAEDPQPRLVRGKIKGTYLQMWGSQLLAGTTDGLYLFDLHEGNGSLLGGTEGVYVKSIYVDQRRRVWLTSNGDGILLYEKAKLTRFPLDRNRYLATSHCIVDDGRGFFWVPTDKGLFQVAVGDLIAYTSDPFEIFYLYHAKNEGFLTNEFNGGCQPCGVKLKSGAIALPSLNGLVWFRPDRMPNRITPASIVLDRILVNRQWLSLTGDRLTLPASHTQVRFFFSTPYYGNAYNLNLAYALVGEDDRVSPSDWIPIQAGDFSIPLSRLEHGAYTLLIRKMTGFGKDNYTIKRIRVIVPPRCYQTWWAKLLLLGVVICVFYLYNALRNKKILREKARLEAIIDKRTESLNLALRDVEESKDEMRRQIHMLSRLLASMTHDIQSPLNYIMLTSGSIPSLIEKGNLDMVSEIGQVISNSSRGMSDLLRGLLNYIKVHVYDNNIQFEAINLRLMVANKYEFFRGASEQSGNTFINDVPVELLVSSDVQMLAIMIHNLIDNAVKYTQKGTIRISTGMGPDGKVTLLVTNSGAGIPSHVIAVINARDQQDGEEPAISFGNKTGLGLLIVKEISALINVTLNVSSSEGETRFTLLFNE